jgi:hypothetical protein
MKKSSGPIIADEGILPTAIALLPSMLNTIRAAFLYPFTLEEPLK